MIELWAWIIFVPGVPVFLYICARAAGRGWYTEKRLSNNRIIDDLFKRRH